LERVNAKKDEVRIEVNPNFYNIDCVRKTGKLFSESCKVSVRKTNDIIEVVLKPKSKKENIGMLGYEFYNHLLNTAKEMRTGI